MESTPQTLEPSIFDELEQERLYNYASTGQRLANFLIDTVIMCNLLAFFAGGLIAVVLLLFGINITETELLTVPAYKYLFNYLVGSICIVIYYAVVEKATGGGSLGKLITSTRVVKEDGSSITLTDAFRRSVCRCVPFEVFSGLGGFPWHDKWTGTMVVRKSSTTL